MATERWALPAPPNEPVQEGARWRWHKPSGEDVAAWFGQQSLDEEMDHKDFVGGVVLIPQSEKVKYTDPAGSTHERYEQVFTPYVQIGTRVGYFHKLAEKRTLIPVIEPVQVPRSNNPGSIYFNGHMDEGLWWHCVKDGSGEVVRYLCATWRVALYERQSYARLLNGQESMPVREGRGTKQVSGGTDPNAIAKAQTGAIGRALGVAGILVIGTGIATAEDMQELPGYGAGGGAPAEQATLPTVPTEIASGEQPDAGMDPSEQLESLRSRALALQTQLQEQGKWEPVAGWWKERSREEGWSSLGDVPLEGLKAVIAKLEQALEAEVPA